MKINSVDSKILVVYKHTNKINNKEYSSLKQACSDCNISANTIKNILNPIRCIKIIFGYSRRIMKLIVVESPNKCHTIAHIMGKDYTVLATAGHIMVIDSVGAYKTGIDTNNDFKISYIFDKTKKDLLKKIKDAAKTADEIFVCSDGDREGEKIADEIRELLKVHEKKLRRAVFNEITEKAVKNAINNPIPFDENMIQAAESRGALDRLCRI